MRNKACPDGSVGAWALFLIALLLCPAAEARQRRKKPPPPPSAEEQIDLSLGKLCVATKKLNAAQIHLARARESKNPAVREMAKFWLDMVEEVGTSQYQAMERAKNLFIEKDNIDGAVAALERLLSKNPLDSTLHYALGDVYFHVPQFCIGGSGLVTWQGIPYAAKREAVLAEALSKNWSEKIAAAKMFADIYAMRAREYTVSCDSVGAAAYKEAAQDYAARARYQYDAVRKLIEQARAEGARPVTTWAVTTILDKTVRQGITIVFPKDQAKEARAVADTLRTRNKRLYNPNKWEYPTIALLPVAPAPPAPAAPPSPPAPLPSGEGSLPSPP